MVTLGVPMGGFIFGFVAYHVGYRWIYYVLAIINGVQFIMYLFFGPETRYLRKGVEHQGSSFKQEYLTFGRIDPTPFRVWDFIHPLTLVMRPSVVIPACAYSMVFLLTGVLITVEIPQLFQEQFGFNAQQLGLQFIGLIVGSIIGEQLGGVLSDKWMKIRSRKIHRNPDPEYRLWLSYIGFILSIVGYVVFLVRTEQAGKHWNITPIIGAAIAAAGNQIVTTVLITYSVDSNIDEAASVGVFITFVRQIWGFIGPFWFPYMFADVGLPASAGIGTALMVAVSIIPTVLLQWKGYSWRRNNHVE